MPFDRVLEMQEGEYKFKEAEDKGGKEHLEDGIEPFFTEREQGFHAAIVCTDLKSNFMTQEEFLTLLTQKNVGRKVALMKDKENKGEAACLCGIVECEDIISCIEEMYNIMKRIREDAESDCQKKSAMEQLEKFVFLVRTLSDDEEEPLSDILKKKRIERISLCLNNVAIFDVRMIFLVDRELFELFLQDDIFFPQQFHYVVRETSQEEQAREEQERRNEELQVQINDIECELAQKIEENVRLREDNIRKDVEIKKLRSRVLYDDYMYKESGYREEDIEKINILVSWVADLGSEKDKDSRLQEEFKKIRTLMLSNVSKKNEDEKRQQSVQTEKMLNQWTNAVLSYGINADNQGNDASGQDKSVGNTSENIDGKQDEQMKPGETRDGMDEPSNLGSDSEQDSKKETGNGSRDDGSRE